MRAVNGSGMVFATLEVKSDQAEAKPIREHKYESNTHP